MKLIKIVEKTALILNIVLVICALIFISKYIIRTPYKDTQEELIEAYEDYYIANEIWLNELEVDYGDLMTGSDANAEYLDKKFVLDSLRYEKSN